MVLRWRTLRFIYYYRLRIIARSTRYCVPDRDVTRNINSKRVLLIIIRIQSLSVWQSLYSQGVVHQILSRDSIALVRV